jgi:hypothetical protein
MLQQQRDAALARVAAASSSSMSSSAAQSTLLLDTTYNAAAQRAYQTTIQTLVAIRDRLTTINLSAANSGASFGEQHLAASTVEDIYDYETHRAQTRVMELSCIRRVSRLLDDIDRLIQEFQDTTKRRHCERVLSPQVAQRAQVEAELQRYQSEVERLQAQLPARPRGRRRGSTSASNRPSQRQRLT